MRRYRGPDARHRARIEAAQPPPWPGQRAFQLLCMWCGGEITRARPGHAAVDRRAVLLRLRSGTKDVATPEKRGTVVRWHLLHRSCDRLGSHYYRIPDSRLCTMPRLLRTTAALTQTHWVPFTGWSELVAHIVRGPVDEEPDAEAARRHAEAAKHAARQEDCDG